MRYLSTGYFKVDGVLMINNKVFGIILGILVGFFSALIYFFFLLPQLLRMKGDLRISFALFSKKDRRGSVLAEVEDEKMTDSMEMAAENVKNHTLKEELEEEDESREVKLHLCPVSNNTISIMSISLKPDESYLFLDDYSLKLLSNSKY